MLPGARHFLLLLASLLAAAWAVPTPDGHSPTFGGDGAVAVRPGRPAPNHGHLTPSTAAASSLEQGDAHNHLHASLVRREAVQAARTIGTGSGSGSGSGGHPFVPSPNISMDSGLNSVVQSSPSAIDLDGRWMTASGMNLTIAGEEVAGSAGTGYKEFIKVSNGGRRVEMHVPEEDTKYWAVLSGRGSLNWNDGDVWSRPIDCVWQPWAIFGACGGPCPAGMQQRRRDFEFLQENGGSPCTGAKEECREAKFCASTDSSSSLLEDTTDPHASTAAGNSSGDNSTGNKSGAIAATAQAGVVALSALLVVAASF